MLSTEDFDRLLSQIKEALPGVLLSKGVNINDLNSDYDGPTITLHSNDFMHFLDGNKQSKSNKYMDIGCALLNIGYENFYFSLQSGNANDGYSYDLFIIYTTDIG